MTVHCGRSVNGSVIEVLSVRAANGDQDALDRSNTGTGQPSKIPTMIF
jgi:hypothetical protein